MSAKPTLVIMAKVPRAGKVKSRLAREIGITRATYFYRHMLKTLTYRLNRDPRWRTILAVTPDCELDSRSLPQGINRLPQGEGDLGQRMQHVFDVLPPAPVIIIGTDIPEISNNHIAHAFRKLGKNDAVVGPSGDGGYWLIGQRRIPRTIRPFANVRWSTPHTQTDTLKNLKVYKTALTDELNDVDNKQEFENLKSAAGRLIWRKS